MSTAPITLTSPVTMSRPDSGPSLARLTAVELRKLRDTRAGLALLLVMVAMMIGMAVLQRTAPMAEQSLVAYLSAVFVPLQMLLPVVAILAVTSEWSHGTALTTFALTPRRWSVAAAKLVAALGTAVVSSAVGIAIAYGAMALDVAQRPGAANWSTSLAALAGTAVRPALYVLLGVGLAFLLRNSAGAIVGYFGIPTLLGLLAFSIPGIDRVSGWIDLDLALGTLADGTMHGPDWAHLASSVGLWVVLPLTIGLYRLQRRDVI